MQLCGCEPFDWQGSATCRTNLHSVWLDLMVVVVVVVVACSFVHGSRSRKLPPRCEQEVPEQDRAMRWPNPARWQTGGFKSGKERQKEAGQVAFDHLLAGSIVANQA